MGRCSSPSTRKAAGSSCTGCRRGSSSTSFSPRRDGSRRGAQPRRAARRHRRRGRAGANVGRGARKAARVTDDSATQKPVGSVSFNRTGTRLATSGQPAGGARIWDVSAGRGEVLTLPGPDTDEHDIAFTPDGRRLVAASGPEGTVRVWSIDTGAKLLEPRSARANRAPVRAVIGVDVSPDGRASRRRARTAARGSSMPRRGASWLS